MRFRPNSPGSRPRPRPAFGCARRDAGIPVQMSVSTQQETITVVAEAPVVDSATTEISTNYNREWVENAPVRRFTFFDLINAAPGVSRGDVDQFAFAVVRLGHQREPLPARRHRLHRAALRRGLAVAQHRRDRRGAGAVARRPRRVRQRGRRRVQHRHPPGLTSSTATATSTTRTRASPAGTPTTPRMAANPTTAPSSATRRCSSAGRSSRTSCGSSARSSTRKTGSRSLARRPSSRPSRTPSATSSSSTTASTRTTGCSSQIHDDFYEIPERATADDRAELHRSEQRPQPVARPDSTPRLSTRPRSSKRATRASTARTEALR